ncbi:rubredoxin [Solimonas sp. K1W22B-7]|uniref:rubredoxin n=1 Tax=Solimonas sp. K1W22B-7 TaxID=2303331 RepID=UPI000E32D9AE|nr:rubredoxin [Solimonas sp. K1W22B-7]AXQ30081.1 rubredoxin [Solimonas sp. K1W22B-7]
MERYQCNGCGYVYEAAKGDPHNGYAPGTPFSALPQDWCCPDCAVREKPDFAVPEETAA